MLISMQVLTEADVVALVQLARRYEEYVDAAGEVRERGSTYASEGRDGVQIKTHPAVAIRDRAWADFQRGLIEFGLTPASRSRITPLAPSQEDDPFAALLDPPR
jgi:P27 family predicted phage terminase small subunit